MFNLEKFKIQTQTITNYNKVFEVETQLMIDALITYYNKFYNSNTFENIVYNSNLFETPTIDGVKIFSIDFYDNIVKVVSTYSTLGSHNAIISIWKGILGESTIVEFIYKDNDNVFTNEINISASADTVGNLTDTNGNKLITTDAEFVQWVINRTGLQINELEAIFNYFIPAGIYIKCNFIANNSLQTRRKLLGENITKRNKRKSNDK